MTAPMTDLTARLRDQQRISPEDALQMRRIVWRDGDIDTAEAEAIFDLNTAVKSPARDWVDFFVEAMSVYLVRQQTPLGYVDATKADWLIAKIDQDGRVDTLGELELLVKILEDATSVPDRLKSYALAQIEAIVATGSGPTRVGGTIDPGCITDAEVGLLRRMLFAHAGDGPAIVSRAEAEMLFRLKDATLGQANAEAWQTLFVQAVGNHVMAYQSYTPLTREDAVRLDAFMADTTSNAPSFLSRMASGLLGKSARPTRDPIDHDAGKAAAQAVTPTEQTWLTGAIDRDGVCDPFEEALRAFIAKEQR